MVAELAPQSVARILVLKSAADRPLARFASTLGVCVGLLAGSTAAAPGSRSRTPLLAGLALAILAGLVGASGSARADTRFEVLRGFGLPHLQGANPATALVLGRDGALYGTTREGGASNAGTVFRIDAAGSFTSLHSFDGTDGSNPSSALVLGNDGALYGTTSSGGASGWGTVFRIDAAGSFTSLHSFNRTDGDYPKAALVLGSDGALYGTTHAGGAFGFGTVFRIDAAGSFTSLRSFDRADGAYPNAALVLGSDGALYGTTAGDGYPSYPGTVFRIDAAGSFTALHVFGGSYSFYPDTALVLGSDGALYGRTGGTVFRIDAAGSFTSLHVFGRMDGISPSAPLVFGSDGALYGTTFDGGAFNLGTVFRIDAAGSFTSLHVFGRTDGISPSAPLVFGSDGALYGTTQYGGAFGNGTVFRIDAAGSFTSLHSFDGTDGAHPYTSPLVLGSDGALYGTTLGGGFPPFPATVFRIDAAGSFSTLQTFESCCAIFSLGAPLVLGSDGAVYGTYGVSYFGGDLGGGYGVGGGVFRIDAAGSFTFLNGLDGGYPSALVLGSDGALYGTTGSGGAFDLGTVYRIDAAGTFTTLHAFDGTDGRNPSSALVLGSDGALYGTTSSGGAEGGGTVYRIDDMGTFTSLHSFDDMDGYNYYYPTAHVVGSDGALYGTTQYGGASNAGIVFRIDAAGSFTTLHSFYPTDGLYPSGALVLGIDGAVYGTTYYGGAFNLGTVYRIDAAGSFSTLHSFGGSDGAYPNAPLVLGSDCALYGTAGGGPGGGGVVYRVFEAGHLCQRIHFDPLPDRRFGDPPFAVSARSSSGLPVSFTASGSCSVRGDQVTLTGAGLCTLTASQAGDADYEPAPEVSQSFHVLFDFQGFLPPVAGAPALNRAHAGRVVPVAFEIGGDPGPDVLEGALVRRVGCDTLEPEGGTEPAASPGASGSRGSGSRGGYAFRWKTEKGWAGSCRELALALVDGSVRRAYFRFESRPLATGRLRKH